MTDEDIIRNTIARYSHCLDDRRFKEWSETFTDDGVFNSRRGRATIYENILTGELATISQLQRRHVVTNVEITIQDDTAETICDLLMYDRLGDAPWTLRVGRYYDTLRRQDDGDWLFTQRRLEWNGPPSAVARRSVEVGSFAHVNPIPVASRIGNVLMSGVVTGRAHGSDSMPATIEEQCAQMFRTVNDIVEAAGGTPANILKMTVWLREANNREALNREWVKMFPDPESRPARHTVPLTGGGDTLVQCDITAVF